MADADDVTCDDSIVFVGVFPSKHEVVSKEAYGLYQLDGYCEILGATDERSADRMEEDMQTAIDDDMSVSTARCSESESCTQSEKVSLCIDKTAYIQWGMDSDDSFFDEDFFDPGPSPSLFPTSQNDD